MKKYLLKKIILSVLFIILSFALIAITFPVINMGILPKYVFLEFCYVFALAVIGFILPMIVQEIGQIFILLIEFLIMLTCASLYVSRGDVFNWELIKQINQLKTVSDMIVIPKKILYIGSALVILYIASCFILRTQKIKLSQFYKPLIIIVSIIVFTFSTLLNVILHYNIKNNYNKNLYFISDAYMYDSFSSSYTSLYLFGYYGYYINDLIRKILPSTKPKIKLQNYNYDYYSSILNNLCKDNNLIMIYGESFDNYAISKELTPTLYALKNGADLTINGIEDFYNITIVDNATYISRKDFSFNDETQCYEFNGINIYNNYEFGLFGLNLNQHKSLESTNISEYKALTSAICKTEYSLPKMLNSKYITNYIHSNTGDYYNRNKYIKNTVGFQNSYFIEDMGDISNGVKYNFNCELLDSDIIKYYTDNPSKSTLFPIDKNFFTFFMTISTHGAYINNYLLNDNYNFIDSVSKSSLCNKTFDLYNSISDADLKQAVKEYFARVLDTEYMFAYLINYLFKNNILENTTIVFCGDHDAYSNNVYNFKKMYDKQINFRNCENYANAVEGFIYSKNITKDYLESNNQSRIISEITEPIDLPPTILTLLGIDYQQDHYLGVPVINKSLNDPTKEIHSNAVKSIAQGYIEGEKLKFYNHNNIKSLDSSYTPTEEELNKFLIDCNNIIIKYYYIESLINPT